MLDEVSVVTQVAIPAPPVGTRRMEKVRKVARYSVWIGFVLAVVVFSALRSEQFLTLDNLQAIVSQCGIPLLLGTGLTLVLVIGEFDLSFAAVTGLAASIAVMLMAKSGASWPVAAVAALAAGLAVGAANGGVVAYLGAQSIIVTLACSSMATGLEYLVGNQETLYSGLDRSYVNVGQTLVLGVGFPAVVAIVFAIVVALILHHTEAGRYMYAVGANPEASRLAGVRVKRLRLAAFAAMGVIAALGGLLITAQSSSYYPDAGVPYLLPAFGSVFLGAAAVGGGGERFTVFGTAFGVLFFQTIRTGLTILNLAPGWVNFTEGALLLAAALLSLSTRVKR